MLTELEQKLLTLALDGGAYSGEADAAAVQLVRQLRKRGASVDDVLGKQDNLFDLPGGRNTIMTFGKYIGVPLDEIPMKYLVWVLRNCDNVTASMRREIEGVVYG